MYYDEHDYDEEQDTFKKKCSKSQEMGDCCPLATANEITFFL
jgi:hypothetical protein